MGIFRNWAQAFGTWLELGDIETMTMDRINRELFVLVTSTAEAISSEMSW